MLGDIGGRSAIFAAERQSLHETQQHQQDRRGDADGGVGGEEADGEGGGAHQPHRHQEGVLAADKVRSEEHTSELQSLMRISYAVFCLKKKIMKIYTASSYTLE